MLPVFPQQPGPLAGSQYPRPIGLLSSRKQPTNPLLPSRLSGSGRHFMVAELSNGALDGVSGTVRYREVFREVSV